LLDLILAAQQDTLAQSVVAQRLAQVSGPAIDTLTLRALDYYLTARPARLAAANALVAQLDARGVSHQMARLQAHTKLMRIHAAGREDALTRQEALAILDLGPAERDADFYATELSPNDPVGTVKDDFLTEAWAVVIHEAVLKDSAALPALVERGRREYVWRQIARPSNRALITKGRCRPENCVPPSDSMAADSVILSRLSRGRGVRRQRGELAEIPIPRVADYWFPLRKGTPVAPAPGVVSLLVPVASFGSYEIDEFLQSFGEREPELAFVRRMVTRYGAAGLDVTLVVVADGHTAMDTNGVVTPAQEAERARWFYQDFAQLPVNVLVQVNHYASRPAPDGRKIWTDTTAFQKLSGLFWSQTAVLVGRDGKGLVSGSLRECQDQGGYVKFCLEDVMAAELDRVLARSSGPSGSSSGSSVPTASSSASVVADSVGSTPHAAASPMRR
jgi:hypothetical protein